MCGCRSNKNDRESRIKQARLLESKRKQKYGVYALENPKTGEQHFFVATLAVIKQKGKEGRICCYYNVEGKNIELKKELQPKAPIKNDKKVQGPKA